MGYQSRLIDDYDYWRETTWFQQREDNHDADEQEQDRRESMRYESPQVRLPVQPRAGWGS